MYDGRKFDESREMEAKVGVVKSASGSAMFRIRFTNITVSSESYTCYRIS